MVSFFPLAQTHTQDTRQGLDGVRSVGDELQRILTIKASVRERTNEGMHFATHNRIECTLKLGWRAPFFFHYENRKHKYSVEWFTERTHKHTHMPGRCVMDVYWWWWAIYIYNIFIDADWVKRLGRKKYRTCTQVR